MSNKSFWNATSVAYPLRNNITVLNCQPNRNVWILQPNRFIEEKPTLKEKMGTDWLRSAALAAFFAASSRDYLYRTHAIRALPCYLRGTLRRALERRSLPL